MSGYKKWQQLEILTAADLQNFIQDQVVQVYNDSTARATALGVDVAEGMVSYLRDTNSTEVYNGLAWVGIGSGDITSVTAGTGLTGGGSSGDVTLNANYAAFGSALALTTGTAGGAAYSAGTAGLAFSAAGTAGQVLTSTGTAVAWADAAASSSSPNYVINGAFDFWQRGTSFASSGYTADRWTGDYVTGAGTVSQQTFTPGEAPVAGYEGQFFLRRAVTTGAQFSSLIHRIEDVRTLAGQTVTLSFWAKGTNPSGNFNINFLQNFGSGGSAQVGVGDQALTITSSWVRYSYTFAIPSISGKTIGDSSYLWLSIYQAGTGTSAFTLDIWGVQLEAGTAATPFKRNANSLQGELAACQRYYQRIQTNQAYGYFAPGVGSTSSLVRVMQYYITSMRSTPSLSTVGSFQLAEGGVLTVSGISNPEASTNQALLLDCATSGATVGLGYFLRANNDTTAAIILSAEL